MNYEQKNSVLKFWTNPVHNPRLSVFDLSMPNPLYSTGYVERAFHNMEVPYKFARENLFLTESLFLQECPEKRLLCWSQGACEVSYGTQVGESKVFKKWCGGFVVVKKVGNLNLLVCASPHSKPILVHLDLWHLQPLVPVTSRLWAVWMGILGFPLLTCIGALIIWRFRAKIFSFVVRGLAEGDRFHVGHEA